MVVQRVNTITKSVKLKISRYAVGLIATARKKSCPQMSKQLSISHDKLYRALLLGEAGISAISRTLIVMVLRLTTAEKGWLIIDDTLISKMFGNLLPGLDYLHDASTHHFYKRAIYGYYCMDEWEDNYTSEF